MRVFVPSFRPCEGFDLVEKEKEESKDLYEAILHIGYLGVKRIKCTITAKFVENNFSIELTHYYF